MTTRTSPLSQSHAGRKLAGGGFKRITAFWSVVGIVVVSAVLSVSLDSTLRMSPASAAPTNLAAPQPAAFIPLTGDIDFVDRFAAEKRNAKSDELPTQF